MNKWCLKRVLPKVYLCFVVALLCAILPTGCGKKGPPKLPDVKTPVGVGNLEAKLDGGDIVLRWTATGAEQGENGVTGYLIYRSTEPLDEDACEGCPVLFQRGAKVPLVDKQGARQVMVYRESFLPDARYRFKVVPYDARGQLGPDSNIVRIDTD